MEGQAVWYQLHNPSHKNNLISCFQEARKFQLQTDQTHASTEVPYPSEDPLKPVEHDADLENDVLDSSLPGGLSCTTCNATFVNLTDQRQHYKLDWHRHNIKRTVHEQKPVSEAEFIEIMDGLSSISGSEDEELVYASSNLSRKIEKVTLVESTLEKIKTQKPPKCCARSSKVFFENSKDQVISFHEVLLPNISQSPQLTENENQSTVFNVTNVLNSPPKWGVVMISGGHFAAGVFQGSKEILHKTIHRYTVRAKQGGSQSRCDNKSGGSGPKSAGASLRRYNELALNQEIQTLLKSWESELSQCQWIFYRAASSSHQVLFGGKTPVFAKNNPQLHTIPFPTKRPTFSEVKKVVSQLCSIQVFNREEFMTRFFPPPTSSVGTETGRSEVKLKKKKDRGRSRSPKGRVEPGRPETPDEASDSELNVEFILEECPTQIDLRNELQENDDSLTSEERIRGIRGRRLRSKKSEKVKIEPFGIVAEILVGLRKVEDGITETDTRLLVRLKQEQDLRKDEMEAFVEDLNQAVDVEDSTVLNISVKKNFLDLVWVLLECGADPSHKDKHGKYAYNWATTKECRNLFRKFRGKFPEKYDYQKAQIPSPLTDQMEQEIAEKKKIQNKLKREKEKLKKAEEKEKEVELDEQKRFLDLSDRDKRALAAERRLLGQSQRNGVVDRVLLRCFDCGLDISGKVPFEYNQNQFCSTKCLARHRKKFPTPLSM